MSVLIQQRMGYQIKQWLRFKMDKSLLYDLYRNKKLRFYESFNKTQATQNWTSYEDLLMEDFEGRT